MKIIFLDRDGVINRNRPDHVKNWQEFEFLPGSLLGLARLKQAGYRVFVLTNQAIVNRGIISKDQLDFIHRQMQIHVAEAGGWIEAVLYCPHRPEEGCSCRKPLPGLIQQTNILYGVSIKNSWLIGDHENDILAGQRAGCRTIMVQSGRGNVATLNSPTLIAKDLASAVELIVELERNQILPGIVSSQVCEVEKYSLKIRG